LLGSCWLLVVVVVVVGIDNGIISWITYASRYRHRCIIIIIIISIYPKYCFYNSRNNENKRQKCDKEKDESNNKCNIKRESSISYNILFDN
jgi:hypothetical protein